MLLQQAGLPVRSALRSSLTSFAAAPALQRGDIEVRRFAPEVPFETSFTAHHQLENTRAALAVCEVLGVPLPAGRRHPDVAHRVLHVSHGETVARMRGRVARRRGAAPLR